MRSEEFDEDENENENENGNGDAIYDLFVDERFW